MSISEDIQDLVAAKKLVLLSSRIYSEPRRRRLYLTSGLYAEITTATGDRSVDMRIAMLRADLDRFTTSKMISPAHIKGLLPVSKGVWEIFSKDPRPGMRVFCMFAKRDCVVATHFANRVDLGGKNSPEWKREIRRTRHTWRQLFGTEHEPLRSNNIHDLLSEAIDDKYFN